MPCHSLSPFPASSLHSVAFTNIQHIIHPLFIFIICLCYWHVTSEGAVLRGAHCYTAPASREVPALWEGLS